MKRLFLFLAIIVILLVYHLNSFVVMTKEFDGKYSVYAAEENITDEYNLSFSQALIKNFLNGSTKQSARFYGDDKDIEKLLDKLDITIVDTQNLANIKIIYGYTPKLGKPALLDGEKVNIQIAKRGAAITVGTPLIVGSY